MNIFGVLRFCRYFIWGHHNIGLYFGFFKGQLGIVLQLLIFQILFGVLEIPDVFFFFFLGGGGGVNGR